MNKDIRKCIDCEVIIYSMLFCLINFALTVVVPVKATYKAVADEEEGEK